MPIPILAFLSKPGALVAALGVLLAGGMTPSLAIAAGNSAASEDFLIVVKRAKLEGNLLTGALFANGERLGTCYERDDLRIKAGTYPGYLRYVSGHDFVQGPFGEMGREGDFLLEIGKVTWSDGQKRTHLLFHGGNKPAQSLGCIMLGPVVRDADGKAVLPDTHPLRLLRLRFYGTDTPNFSPQRRIVITIQDRP